MEASQIKVGHQYAMTTKPRGGYGSRFKVEVLQSLTLNIPRYDRWAYEKQLRETYGANRIWTHQGKTHYLVAQINLDDDNRVEGQTWIVYSGQLVEPWTSYKARNREADERRKREAQERADREARQETVVEMLQALGIESAEGVYMTHVRMTIEDAEVIVNTIIERVD